MNNEIKYKVIKNLIHNGKEIKKGSIITDMKLLKEISSKHYAKIKETK